MKTILLASTKWLTSVQEPSKSSPSLAIIGTPVDDIATTDSIGIPSTGVDRAAGSGADPPLPLAVPAEAGHQFVEAHAELAALGIAGPLLHPRHPGGGILFPGL